jgi:alanine-synthesizing transaminase
MSNRCVPGSRRLNEVRYDIRGELARRALALEAQGRAIVKLNIGNPGVFGLDTPAHLREALQAGVLRSDAYVHEQGLLAAREAIARRDHARGIVDAHPERIWLGNGVSELIDLALRALLDPGDEVLVPSPDYPLWTASVLLNGGVAKHYPCRVEHGFVPDAAEIEAMVTPRTRALVVINPNNPTGAVYPRETLRAIVDIARRHRLVLMSDEIYDDIVYDDADMVPLATLAGDVVCLSFGGLSKVHRACGWRAGWLALNGATVEAQPYRQALDLLATLRLCANVPAQHAIAPALEGPRTIAALTAPDGRLHASRAAVMQACAASEFLGPVAPRGAIYAFPGVDTHKLPGLDDEAFALELLETENVLLTPGSGFNVPYRNHVRVTLLPEADLLVDVFARIERVLARTAERLVRAAAVA